MYHLTQQERLNLAQYVKQRVDNRVIVVASGTFGGTIESQADFVVQISKFCDAVVVLTCQLATKDQTDEIWIQNAQKLLDLTSNVQLGLYECPEPYKRVLSPETLKWAAQSNRFFFHKDTCCSTDQIIKKIQAVKSISKTPFRFYNANIATLSSSCEAGGDGFCGISANFYPYFHAELLRLIFSEGYHQNGEMQEKAKKIQRFLCVAENVVADCYPGSAKLYLAEYGEKNGHLMSSFCRKSKFSFQEEQLIRIKDLYLLQKDMCKLLGIEEVPF